LSQLALLKEAHLRVETPSGLDKIGCPNEQTPAVLIVAREVVCVGSMGLEKKGVDMVVSGH
jgi:hypothetical protein